jgi:hypothetical protein
VQTHIFNSLIFDKNRNTNETTVTYQREYNKANIEAFKDASQTSYSPENITPTQKKS